VVGLTAANAGAASVLLTDYDADVLRLAADSASVNGVGGVVSTARVDWTQTQEAADALPSCSLVLAADVLYDQQNALNIGRLLPKLLVEPGARCLIADQVQWPWRELFEGTIAEGGLSLATMEIPGPEEVLLLSVGRDDE